MNQLESILIVTQRTALEDLISRFNTRSQAEFYIEQTAKQNPEYQGGEFSRYEQAHEAYCLALEQLLKSLPKGIKYQQIERGFLPNFKFSGRDLIITLGRDGLVINTAKYLSREPILALNPDPLRVDGVLIPFHVAEAQHRISLAFSGDSRIKEISMAKAELNDGQIIYAVNDLFVGARTHVSARYSIKFNQVSENHSSSGIIISTGAGSTGWLQSVLTGASQISQNISKEKLEIPTAEQYRLDWSSRELYFAVREPFTSKTSQASLVFGKIGLNQKLHLTSLMPDYGVIFSDGIENDYLNFNSGAVASIGLAERQANLIVR